MDIKSRKLVVQFSEVDGVALKLTINNAKAGVSKTDFTMANTYMQTGKEAYAPELGDIESAYYVVQYEEPVDVK